MSDPIFKIKTQAIANNYSNLSIHKDWLFHIVFVGDVERTFSFWTHMDLFRMSLTSVTSLNLLQSCNDVIHGRALHDAFFKKLLNHLKSTLQRRTTTKYTFSNMKIL